MLSTPPRARRPGRPSQPIERGKLVAIAAGVFAERGYDAASLGEIAEATGLRKASLYHHFPTKDALYRAVLDSVVGDLRRLVVGARLRTGDFVERLDRLGLLVIDYFAGHPDAAKLLVREMVGDGRYLDGPGAEEIGSSLAATAAFLEAGMDAGVFRRQDPRELAISIVGLHVLYFAAPRMTGGFLGRDIFAAGPVGDRKAAVLQQVRALCLVPDTVGGRASRAAARRRR